jgi:NDP-sugar pyrophosphorylase family protein
LKAVILAGGKGTRLAPFTRVFPKSMLPIGDRVILEILLGQIKHAGINDVILTVGDQAGIMRAFFQDGKRYNLNITYSQESQPLGTAGPIAKIEDLTETFLVTNGDVLTLMEMNDLIRFHKKQKSVCTIAMHTKKVKINLGVIEQKRGYKITGYTEKPTLDYKVSMGVYVFEPQVLEYIPTGEYFDFPDLVKKLIKAGKRVVGYPFNGYWKDLGTPEDYEQAIQDFDEMRAQFLKEE